MHGGTVCVPTLGERFDSRGSLRRTLKSRSHPLSYLTGPGFCRGGPGSHHPSVHLQSCPGVHLCGGVRWVWDGSVSREEKGGTEGDRGRGPRPLPSQCPKSQSVWTKVWDDTVNEHILEPVSPPRRTRVTLPPYLSHSPKVLRDERPDRPPPVGIRGRQKG